MPRMATTTLCIFLPLMICACTRSVSQPTNPFIGGGKAVTGTSGDIRGHAEAANVIAVDGLKIAPELPHWLRITDHQQQIVILSRRLDEQAKALEQAEGACERVRDENAKLKDESEKSSRWVWRMFQIFGGAGVVGAAVVAYFAPPLGLVIFIAAATSLGIGTFMLSYSWVVNVVIGGLVVLAGVAGGLAIWKKFTADTKEAGREADIYEDALKGKATIREVVAARRGSWDLLDTAMTERKARAAATPEATP